MVILFENSHLFLHFYPFLETESLQFLCIQLHEKKAYRKKTKKKKKLCTQLNIIQISRTNTLEKKKSDKDSLEFAIEISPDSFGSSQTFPFPHFKTLAASRFCNFNDTIAAATWNSHKTKDLTIRTSAKAQTSLKIIKNKKNEKVMTDFFGSPTRFRRNIYTFEAISSKENKIEEMRMRRTSSDPLNSSFHSSFHSGVSEKIMPKNAVMQRNPRILLEKNR